LEIEGYIFYLDNTKIIPNKLLYFNKKKPRSIEFNIKYINKLNEYETNKKKVLGVFKLIINPDNINKFKNKNSILLL
jgi:hypothetical protein